MDKKQSRRQCRGSDAEKFTKAVKDIDDKNEQQSMIRIFAQFMAEVNKSTGAENLKQDGYYLLSGFDRDLVVPKN